MKIYLEGMWRDTLVLSMPELLNQLAKFLSYSAFSDVLSIPVERSLEVIVVEIHLETHGVAQALYNAVHVARVCQVLQSGNARLLKQYNLLVRLVTYKYYIIVEERGVSYKSITFEDLSEMANNVSWYELATKVHHTFPRLGAI